ncbi:uncharacterized protein LOC108037001 [Drosophila rhopaloa]|uniref:Uncharacterized protein LOC108037001 n=1 Tax=Drosophila rhopaloa TaxID=1041015 RepID=A0A6P4DXV7_DRORH|nr:uncharacterized protein LOC108037001 [Drosophila rhopaloa]XP_044313150.1 uncharacterized protein LOC108037001 [Drosophila rhopaloa]
MPEKPAAKSPPKPLNSIKGTRTSTSSSKSTSNRNRPTGAAVIRPPLPNAHDRIWKIMKM